MPRRARRFKNNNIDIDGYAKTPAARPLPIPISCTLRHTHTHTRTYLPYYRFGAHPQDLFPCYFTPWVPSLLLPFPLRRWYSYQSPPQHTHRNIRKCNSLRQFIFTHLVCLGSFPLRDAFASCNPVLRARCVVKQEWHLSFELSASFLNCFNFHFVDEAKSCPSSRSLAWRVGVRRLFL